MKTTSLRHLLCLRALPWCFALVLVSAIPSYGETSDVDARKVLESAILSDSSGSIVLKRFAKLEEKRGEEDGRAFIQTHYKAELEFETTGVWQFSSGTGKRSFRINVPPDFMSGPGGNLAKLVAEQKWYEKNTGAAVKRGERTTITGFLVFALSDAGWILVKHEFDLCWTPNPWVLPPSTDTRPEQ